MSLAKNDNVILQNEFLERQYSLDSVGVDSAVGAINAFLTNVAKGSLKKRSSRRGGRRKQKKDYTFDKTVYNVRTQLHYVKNLKHKYPHNRCIRDQYYSLKHMFEKEVKKHKVRLKEELLNQMNTFHDKDTRKYWDIFNKLRGGKNNTSKMVISADKWVNHYRSLYNKPLDYDNNILEELYSTERESTMQKQLDDDISDKEMYDAIKTIKTGKSPGPDAIINEMIKCGKFYLVPMLKKLFNHILHSECFPAEWKKGYIINIHKSGSMSDPNNYRGITLTSCLGKLFSIIMNARLVQYLNAENIYSDFQFGFRAEHRTTDSIYILNEIMSQYRKSNKKLYVAFIDFHKAFDKVWRAALLLKLMKLGIGGHFYRVIKSMYTDNLSAVRLDGVYSEYFECPLGVRQGDGLSPTLFNVFMNDVHSLFHDVGCHPAKYGE